MDNENPENKRFEQLGSHLVGMYREIAVLLDTLPIPIGVPRFPVGGEFIAAQAVEGIVEARLRLRDMPGISARLRTVVRTAMEHWLTAADLAVLAAVTEYPEWRLDLVSRALIRSQRDIYRAAEMLASGGEG